MKLKIHYMKNKFKVAYATAFHVMQYLSQSPYSKQILKLVR